MDNNFDENIAAESDSSGGTAMEENTRNNIREQQEPQSVLRELQATVTDPAASMPQNGDETVNTQNSVQFGQQLQQPQSITENGFPPPNAQIMPNVQNTGSTPEIPNIQQGQFGQQQFQQFGQYPQDIQNMNGQGGTPQFAQNFGSMPQYSPPPQNQQGIGHGNYPPPIQPPPRPAQGKKRFSGGCFWSLISAIAVMFAAVVILAVKIASGTSSKTPDNGGESKFDNLAETQKAEHVVIDIPTAEKPQLDDEFYADKKSGLLTSVGVAKTILPSQVQIKVFDDIPYMPVSSGSGIILTEDGYILTNAHVVDGAKRLSVGFYGDGESEAVIVGIDKKSDLAVVKVNKSGLTPAQIGTSSTLEIGEEVALAGAGGGFENTVTYGHVTGLGREIDTDYISSSTINCIQSDAALNPGNSGGALVNMYGQVVGVAVALMNHETYENIGFCIAIDDAVPIAEDLIAQGYVSSRTRVGITYLSIGDAAANGYGIPAGLCVMDVDPRSGAIYAGLKPYDVITHIDGQRVFGASEISEILADKLPGDTITISVFRKEITGETDIFDAELELVADTSSVSGYNVTDENEDFFSRDIIK